MSSPLRAVLDAFAADAHSLAEVQQATGLRADVVESAVEQLVRLGRLDREQVGAGCTTGGCGGCGSSPDAGGSCGSAHSAGSGPVLVALSIRRTA
ncbi:MAG: hypothetical protein JWN17_971 [Frankiales bacterium]|nr:hypothetical protein [Frankiales bacterium]